MYYLVRRLTVIPIYDGLFICKSFGLLKDFYFRDSVGHTIVTGVVVEPYFFPRKKETGTTVRSSSFPVAVTNSNTTQGLGFCPRK